MAAIPDSRIVQLDKWYSQLLTQRNMFEALWRELITYVRPLRMSPLVIQTTGQNQLTAIFDPTAIQSNTSLASAMQGSLTSTAMPWFSLRMRLDELNDDLETQQWLETCAARIFKALCASNFGADGIEAYLDLGAFGISATLMTESPVRYPGVRFSGFQFETVGLGEYVISEGPGGLINTFARCLVKPAIAVKQQWPNAPALSADFSMQVTADPFAPVEIIHAIFPRGLWEGAALDPKPFCSVYWLAKDKQLLSESGYWEFPALVPRWAKSSQEVYGRGPGHSVLPAVKTLNRAVELGLKAWDKAIDPPLKALAEGVVGSVRMTPGGISYVQDMNALQPLNTGAVANLNWTQLELQTMRQQIKEMFYNSQLELPNQPYMTAEEVVKRYELMERLLGPTLGRLESEYLAPLIRRAFLMLLRAGILPPPPSAVRQAMSKGFSEIDIQYEGPLARSQRLTEVQAIQKTIAFVEPIAQLKPEVLDNFKFDDIVRKGAVDAGLQAAMLVDPADVNNVRKQRAQLQAQQAKAQLDQARAQTAANLGQAAQSGAAAQSTMQESQQSSPGVTPADARVS